MYELPGANNNNARESHKLPSLKLRNSLYGAEILREHCPEKPDQNQFGKAAEPPGRQLLGASDHPFFPEYLDYASIVRLDLYLNNKAENFS